MVSQSKSVTSVQPGLSVLNGGYRFFPDLVETPEEILIGTPAREEWVHLDSLVIDGPQRDFRPQHAKFIADNFDPKRVYKIQVSPRPDGMRHVIDGQHRVGAMRLKYAGNTHSVRVLCDVYDGFTHDEEALKFLDHNQYNSKAGSFEAFLIEVERGDPFHVTLQKIIAEQGFRATKSTCHNGFSGVSEFVKIVTGYGPRNRPLPNGFERLSEVLSVIREAWGGSTDGVNYAIIGGIAGFLLKYGKHPNYQRTRLIRVLSKTTARERFGAVDDETTRRKKRKLTVGDPRKVLMYTIIEDYNDNLHGHNRLPE